jgi:glucokinase
VVAERATLTNVQWDVSADDIRGHLGITRVALLNDLEALAASVECLADDEIATLQNGVERPDGNAVVIAAGTGLGQAYLHRVGGGRLRPMASEGGHADFAARTDREFELVRMLRDRDGRAEVEQVVSGLGLVNLHQFTHAGRPCPVVERLDDVDAQARMTQGAMSGRCPLCGEALGMFVAAYGAEAGNLALRGLATAGVYVGGGIAPKILPALQDGRFMEAFRAKTPMAELVASMPVRVILTPQAGLLGAAVHARDLASA